MQFARPPAFTSQIDQTAKLIRHGLCAGFSNLQCAGGQEPLRPAIQLVGVVARRELKFRHSVADEMVVPEGQSLGSNRFAGVVLQVNAAWQWLGVVANDSEADLTAMGSRKPGTGQNSGNKNPPETTLWLTTSLHHADM